MGKIGRSLASAAGCAVLGLALALAGCGGGGGGDSPSGTTPPPTTPPPPPPTPPAATDYTLPAISTDTYPSGARVDVSMRNLMPLHAGDSAAYVRSVAGAVSGTASREVAAAVDTAGNLVLTETDGSVSVVERYQVTGDGLVLLDPLRAQGTLPGAYDALPSVVLYPSPFYPAGSTVIHFRQGSLNADIDGDGRSDYFSATVIQTFVGFETMALFGASTGVAHLRTDLTFTTQSVATGARKTSRRVEDVWLASGIGPVRIDRSVTVDGVAQPLRRLDLQAATIAGVQFGAGIGTSGPNLALALQHEFLVYDAPRKVYYASMSSTSPQGNRIATIDALTGAVAYSAAIGSSPKAMAVSSDGASLWVALDGSGEIVRLRLPGMTEAARVRLPSTGFSGQAFAEELAASPTAGNVVAVSMYVKGLSPRYAGVGLVRGDVLQPTISQNFLGANSIGFDVSGSWLYGYDNEVTEFGLHRFDVLADGLVERNVVSADARFYSRLRVADGLIVISSKVFSTGATPALLGTVDGATDCVKLPGVAKIACHSDDLNDASTLVVVDSVSYARFDTLSYAATADPVFYGRWRLVPGMTGQVAVSEPERVVLYSNDALR